MALTSTTTATIMAMTAMHILISPPATVPRCPTASLARRNHVNTAMQIVPQVRIKSPAHAATATTDVRIAVAESESIFFTPHFDSIAVIAANTADIAAANIHIFPSGHLKDCKIHYITTHNPCTALRRHFKNNGNLRLNIVRSAVKIRKI